MKRVAYFLTILSILMFACNLPTSVIPSTATSSSPETAISTVPVAPTATEIPTKPVAPTAIEPPAATEPPVPQVNVNCNELAFFLDPALATGSHCETIAASTEGMEVHPQYTQLTLQGYVLSDKFFTAHISVLPVQAYTNLLPDSIPPDVAKLQALIGGGATGDKGLPLLPYFNAGQEFFAQYKVMSFGNGKGIRYLTQYTQFIDPINNHEMFYTFQGLTNDGKYWVSAVLPISNPILPADGNNPPNGQSQEEFSNNFVTYIADITAKLNSQPSENFSPTLTMLDGLVNSIKIQT